MDIGLFAFVMDIGLFAFVMDIGLFAFVMDIGLFAFVMDIGLGTMPLAVSLAFLCERRPVKSSPEPLRFRFDFDFLESNLCSFSFPSTSTPPLVKRSLIRSIPLEIFFSISSVQA
jgi:hypothetical protein